MHALIVTEQGTHLNAEGNLLLLSRSGHIVRRVRAADVNQVILMGRIEISSGFVALVARRAIDVIWLTQAGKFRARLVQRGSRNVALRLAQYRCVTADAFCLAIAAPLVAGKIRHQRELLLRGQRRLNDPDLAVALGQMRILAERTATVASLDSLRGLEGQAAAVYFGQFGKLLKPGGFSFTVRSRRPPRDPVNACLSFGYAVLGSIVETEILRCGLDPLLGFFHQPAYGRPSLMLDLLEEFRPFVDALTLRLINRRQLAVSDFDRHTGATLEELLAERVDAAPQDNEPDSPEFDDVPGEAEEQAGGQAATSPRPPPFDLPTSAVPAPAESAPVAAGAVPMSAAGPDAAVVGVYLGDVGRKIFLKELFERLREPLLYPPRQAALELRDIIREQAYHLARVIESREPAYSPFVPHISGG